MIQFIFQRLALILFCIYLAVFPGSTIVVALDRVPGWGTWMGGGLLLLQGATALCWLLGWHGARGARAALLVFLLAWAVEHVGVLSGVPFGRYHYTDALQPQLFGIVPLAIPCAWLMVATGAWQLATTDLSIPLRAGDRRRILRRGSGRATDDRRQQSVVSGRSSVVVAATLVLLLDLQIETVATKINQYWIWLDGGPYYGVPTANFVAWWLTGLAMAVVVARVLGGLGDWEIGRRGDRTICLASHVVRRLPAYLYLLSTLMFAIINLVHGYTVAGLVGVLVLFVVACVPQGRYFLTRRRGDAERFELT
jgi:bisanhydrobacterioruberin hydratase